MYYIINTLKCIKRTFFFCAAIFRFWMAVGIPVGVTAGDFFCVPEVDGTGSGGGGGGIMAEGDLGAFRISNPEWDDAVNIRIAYYFCFTFN